MEKYNLNTIRKDLKIVYSDNGSISLVFQDNNILKGVVGELDSNLKELEKQFAIFSQRHISYQLKLSDCLMYMDHYKI